MASIVDEIRAKTKRPGLPCKIAAFLAAADKKTAAGFAEAMHADDISSRAIAEWLGTRDVDLSPGQVDHHRRNGCAHCRHLGHDLKRRR